MRVYTRGPQSPSQERRATAASASASASARPNSRPPRERPTATVRPSGSRLKRLKRYVVARSGGEQAAQPCRAARCRC